MSLWWFKGVVWSIVADPKNKALFWEPRLFRSRLASISRRHTSYWMGLVYHIYIAIEDAVFWLL